MPVLILVLVGLAGYSTLLFVAAEKITAAVQLLHFAALHVPH